MDCFLFDYLKKNCVGRVWLFLFSADVLVSFSVDFSGMYLMECCGIFVELFEEIFFFLHLSSMSTMTDGMPGYSCTISTKSL